MKNTHKAKATAPSFAARSTQLTSSTVACLLGCAALLLAAAGPAFAQITNVSNIYNVLSETVPATVNSVTLESYTADKARLTIAVNEAGSAATQIRVTLAPGETTLVSSVTNFIDPDYYITNYYNLKPGVATLAATGVPATGGGAGVVLGAQSITNSSGDNASFTVPVTLNYNNLASGDYDMAVEATGANTWRYPIPVKAGYKWSAGGVADINFATAANWIGGVVPGANDIVILDDAGAVSGSTTPTIAITTDTTIGSVSDIHTGDNYTHWNIAAGATLSILGNGGFRQLVDLIDDSERSRIRGSGAGTLVISNANAEFNMFTTRQNNSHDSADFSALNTLIIDVNKISFNDLAAYPNYGTNGIMNRPYRNVYDMDWALTNILRATHTDANGWTTDAREYGLVINREYVSGQTGNDGGMHFGIWNELYFDSILLGGYSQMENPEVDFRASSGNYLKLRNTDKISRVSNLTIADAADYYETGNNAGGGTKIDVSFTRGTVDALIDTLIIGREPRYTANGPANGKLFLGAGTFDVNNAYLGYQTGPALGTEEGYAQGRVELSNGGIFRVNDTLVLGYTVTNNLQTINGGGTLVISGAGSAAEINRITVGGPVNASLNNDITVSTGGTLVVSNAAGSATARIRTLSMSDSTITLFPDVGTNAPCVYVTNLTTSGSGNTIKLAALTGVTAYPAEVPLISFVNPPAPNFGLELPPGLYGYLKLDNANGTINAVISTTPPQSLVWNGNVNGDWDTSTANWQGGKKFIDGDGVTFDDTAVGTTSVNVPGVVTVGSGGILVSNDTKAYSLSGSSIEGSAIMTKEGTNTLTLGLSTPLAVFVNAGTLINGSFGTIGATTVDTDAVLNNQATINKLVTRGITENSGTIELSVSVQDGIFNNSGTINGGFTTSGNSVTTNTSSSFVYATGNSTVDAGSILVQEGEFKNLSGRLNVVGTLTGSGYVWTEAGDTGRVAIRPGGVFTPGGANQIGTFAVGARFDLDEGSPDGVLVIDIDLNHPQRNDLVAVDKFSNFRGSFHFNNIGTIPFAVGQSFMVYSNNFGFPNTPEASNNYLNKTVPAVPGVGLQWDFSNLKTNGIVAVVAAPSTPPQITSAILGGTNITISWPASHIGYQLQVQTNNLTVGLSNNWYPVGGTEFVTSTNLPIDAANPTVFYRLSNQ